MFLDSVGIILRKNELSPHKIIILDKLQGKIECVSSTPSLSAGSLITYNIKKQGQKHLISDSTLVYIPLSLAQTDMLFFHHVLELIYYFTNVGNCASEVFDLLAFLYSTDHTEMTILCKKFFLLKLLTCMGSVPEMSQARTQSITYFNTLSIEQLIAISISSSDEIELDRWLWCCVWQHPYVNEFKTAHFLAENRTI
jgi:hypothetical protein